MKFCRNSSFWLRLAAPALALVLLVPALAACGKDEKTATPTPSATPVATATATTAPTATATVAPTATATVTATATPTRTATAAPTPTTAPTATPTATPAPTATATPTATPNTTPVKIGIIGAWTGPIAVVGGFIDGMVGVVQKQLTDTGGVLGGRTVQIIKYDNGSIVAGTQSGWVKLATGDKVSGIAFGGGTSADLAASSDLAEQYKILYTDPGGSPIDLSARPYTVRAVPQTSAQEDSVTSLALNTLKPKTIGIMADDLAELRLRMGAVKATLAAAGVKTVSEQYVPTATTDFSPYLTRLKFIKPDLVITAFASANATVFKQIMDLGGWGTIKYVNMISNSSTAATYALPGAEGTYTWVAWISGLALPASQKLEKDYLDVNKGPVPGSGPVTIYQTLMTIMNAINLAGTDSPQAVAQAARSGKLTWDSPMGTLTIGTNGETNLKGFMAVVQGGKLVPLP